MIGLFRLLIILLIGYYVVRFVRRLFQPKNVDSRVRGESKKSDKNNSMKNIEDADYEEIE